MFIRFQYIEDIRRLRGDMDFMFEWQKQYLKYQTISRVSSSIKIT
jgi:hypothetical protein